MSKKGGKMDGGQLGAPKFEEGSVNTEDLKDFVGEVGSDYRSQFTCVEDLQAKVTGNWRFDLQSALRYSIGQYALVYDAHVRGKVKGIPRCVFQDEEMERAIAVDLVSCKKWKKMPLFVVMYNVMEKKEAGTPMFNRAIEDQQSFFNEMQRDEENRLMEVKMDLAEQDMLISMLEHNTKMLSKECRKALAAKHGRNGLYSPSTIVPLGRPYVDEGSGKLPCALCGYTPHSPFPHSPSPHIPCPMPYALCPMPYSPCDMLSACPIPLTLRS
jgi:hypothetical protein